MSDHFDGKLFHNPKMSPSTNKGFLDALKWKWTSRRKPWPEKANNFARKERLKEVEEDEMSVTFINHSTVLIRFKSLSILTDPVFSDRVGPFSFLSIERRQSPGLSIEELPKIDQVFISHNHYDHLDLPSIQKIWERDRPLFITPLKNGKILRKAGVNNVIELDWWESVGPLTVTPAQHWSGRGLFDRFKALWGGFFITVRPWNLFYAGDTGYSKHFEQIKERLGSIDLALLPIGAYEPRWFMKEQHLCPEEAVKAHLDLEAKKSMGIHFGTFPLADEGFEDPEEDLNKSLLLHHLDKEAFIVPKQGETITLQK